MRFINFFLFTAVFLFFSCTKKKDNIVEPEENTIIIELEQAFREKSNKVILTSSFADEITYIPLETNGNCLIGGGSLEGTFVSENYVLCKTYLFHKNGKAIRKLGQRGQGPNEYIMLLSDDFDEKRKEYYVLDNYKPYILIYNFDNQFVKKIKVADAARSIFALGDGKIILQRDFHVAAHPDYDFFEYMVLDVDTEQVVYTKKVSFDEMENPFTDKKNLLALKKNSFWTYNDTTFYFEAFTDTVFSLTKEGQIDKPKYVFNLGKHKLNFEEIKKIDPNNWFSHKHDYMTISDFCESSDYLLFKVFNKGGSQGGYYNKRKGEVHFFTSGNTAKMMINDMDGGAQFLFANAKTKNIGFAFLWAEKAVELLNESMENNSDYDIALNKKFRENIKDIKDDDNPIICIYKLK